MGGVEMTNLIILLEKLVAINSVYPNEAKLGLFLIDYLIKLGFSVEKQPISQSRFNILASRGSGQSAICFYGHLDTVPSNDTGWQNPPLELTKDKEILIGRGVYDMKGGIAAFLIAIEDYKGYLKIFLAVDEENISEGAWKAVKEKVDFFQDIELVISAEPGFGDKLNTITRGRTGRVVFEVEFNGKPVHIALYQEGIDAIELLGSFISKFYSQRESLFTSPKTKALVRKIEGESHGISVCGFSRLELEVFLDARDSIQQVQERIQTLTDAKVSLKKRATPYLEGYFFENVPYQNQLKKVIKNQLNQSLALAERSSVGDDNVIATLKIPVITWGPQGGNAHTANEWVNSQSLETLSNLFKEFLNLI